MTSGLISAGHQPSARRCCSARSFGTARLMFTARLSLYCRQQELSFSGARTHAHPVRSFKIKHERRVTSGKIFDGDEVIERGSSSTRYCYKRVNFLFTCKHTYEISEHDDIVLKLPKLFLVFMNSVVHKNLTNISFMKTKQKRKQKHSLKSLLLKEQIILFYFFSW